MSLTLNNLPKTGQFPPRKQTRTFLSHIKSCISSKSNLDGFLHHGINVKRESTAFDTRVFKIESGIADSLMGNTNTCLDSRSGGCIPCFDSLCVKRGRNGMTTVCLSNGNKYPHNEKDRQRLSELSKSVSDHAVTLLSTYSNPDSLLRNLPFIVNELNNMVVNMSSESTLAVKILALRSFYCVDKNEFRIAGLSIGDSSVGFIEPTSGKFNPLIEPSLLNTPECGQLGKSANLSTKTIDSLVPKNTLLYVASNSITTHFLQGELPFQVQLKDTPTENKVSLFLNSVQQKIKENFSDMLHDVATLRSEKQTRHERNAMAIMMGLPPQSTQTIFTPEQEAYLSLLEDPNLHDVTFSIIPLGFT